MCAGNVSCGERRWDADAGYRACVALVLGALIVCALCGNACVVAAVALERSLRTVAHYLIGSLAVADLLVSVLVLPAAALQQVLDGWTLGAAACHLFICLDVLCCTSSILHLCAIALDRYWAITAPVGYLRKRTPRRAAALVGATWLVGFSISVPPLLIVRGAAAAAAEEEEEAGGGSGVGGEDGGGGGGGGEPTHCRIRQDPWYTIYSTFGAFYIPLALMLVLYGRIFKAARFRIRRTARRPHRKKVSACPAEPRPPPAAEPEDTDAPDAPDVIEVDAEPPPPPPPPPLFRSRRAEEATEARRKMALARERKTVKTLGIIMGTFILCWLPFFILALVMPFCRLCALPRWLEDVCGWLGYSNSLLNPIIYAYFNKDFQSAFKKILRCHCCSP